MLKIIPVQWVHHTRE